ncbi:MAG: sel1 repeat family protein [Erysipelotrichaceae bacterium]|nr:sel1 repeat family protein [Erysipelotrichaceae bacterium]
MVSVGEHYLEGLGVQIDLEEAKKWYQKAAEAGNKTAMKNLSYCYENGYGVEKIGENQFVGK